MTGVRKPFDFVRRGYVQISMVPGDYDTDPIGVCVLELEVVKAKYPVAASPKPN